MIQVKVSIPSIDFFVQNGHADVWWADFMAFLYKYVSNIFFWKM